MEEEVKERIAAAEAAPRANWIVRVWRFYADGFKSMTVGRYLWAIILIKLFILFVIMRLFFFPNILSRDYDSDEERAQAVRTNLTRPAE